MKRLILMGMILGLAAASARAACFTTAGTPAGGNITAVLTPSRISGVAPLAVFFDSTGTLATSTLRPFHDLAYCWDFGDPWNPGDPGSGTFLLTDGKSKNEARGPVAGHVFEKPGTYTVTLEVRDSQDRWTTQSAVITVSDPDAVFSGANTRCFANGADNPTNFGDCPPGATHVPNVTSLFTLQSHVAAGRRLLLRRGDTFTGGGVRINVAGPGLVGAYGSGSRPLVMGSSVTLFSISDSAPAFSDWRIMDIELDGQGQSSSKIVNVQGTSSDLLLLRLKGANTGTPIAATLSILDFWTDNGFPGHDATDVLAIQDTELRSITGGSGDNISNIAAHRFIFQGNIYNDSMLGEHILRVFWADRAVLSHNDMGHVGGIRLIIKMHAPKFNGMTLGGNPVVGYGRYTERVLVSDNVFRCTGGHDWSVGFGAQNNTSDERLRDILVERNLFLPAAPGEGHQIALVIEAQDVTVRDNVIIVDSNALCAGISSPGVAPQPQNVALIHNTCYKDNSVPTQTTRLVSVAAAYPGITAANNLIAGPGPALTFASQMGNIGTQAANLTFTTAGAAGFVSPAPAAAVDFMLTAGSPVVGAGDPAYRTISDHAGAQRTDAAPDPGAFELAGPADAMPPARPRNLRVR